VYNIFIPEKFIQRTDTQAGTWQQYDNNDESRSREGVGGFLVDFPRPIIGYFEYL
jgi:hypothetical protein